MHTDLSSTTYTMRVSLQESAEGFRVLVNLPEAMWPWTRAGEWSATREDALAQIPTIVKPLYKPRRPAPDIEDY